MSISFKIKAKALLAGIEPALIVSTNSTVKECASANHISLEATPEVLFANANNGRVSVRNPIPYQTTYCTEYQFKGGGNATIRTGDLVSTLASFNEDEILHIETTESKREAIDENASDDEKLIWQSMTGMALKLIPESDPTQFQTLPILNVRVEFDQLKQQTLETITVNRDSFVRTMQRVLFAGGFELKREKFMYWVLRSDKNHIRGAATSGSRLALNDIRGERITDTKEPRSILMPVEASAAILKVFKDCPTNEITIRNFGKKITVEADGLSVAIVGINPNINWIDENKYVVRKNLYKFVIAVSELQMAVKGMVATNSDEEKKRDPVHTITLNFDAETKVVSLQSDRGSKKALRKAKMNDVWVAEDQPHTVSFKCVVNFVAEAVKYAEKSQYLQFELVSNELPMLVKFYAGEKVTHERMFSTSATANGDEEFTMMIARLSEDK